ncbi:MAG: hypothetical protein ACT4O3_10425 [Elusimicrobiota bacterium]
MTAKPFRDLLAGQSGYAVLMVIVLSLLGLGVLMPALVRSVQMESKASTTQKKSLTALQLAESGISQGYWKLIEKRPDHWDQLIAAGTSAFWLGGYQHEQTYQDPAGGGYRIRITSATVGGSDRAVIEATGKDPTGQSFRAVRAIYKP